MNETVNKFLLVGDKLISEIHLRQPGFNYSDTAFNIKSEIISNQQLANELHKPIIRKFAK